MAKKMSRKIRKDRVIYVIMIAAFIIICISMLIISLTNLHPQADASSIILTEPLESKLNDTASLTEQTSLSSQISEFESAALTNPETVIQTEADDTSQPGSSIPETQAETSPPAVTQNEADSYYPDEPTYINGILIVNKTYPLPEDYNPGSLDETVVNSFHVMQYDAEQLGLNIYISSGFRSFSDQYRIYNNYVDSYGQDAADTFSARAGHSEHQTGLAFDLNTIDDSFADTAEGAWVAENAHYYGFIIRYPKGKEAITGYKYESWHLRYVGVELATELYQSGLTLEEYLDITSAYKSN